MICCRHGYHRDHHRPLDRPPARLRPHRRRARRRCVARGPSRPRPQRSRPAARAQLRTQRAAPAPRPRRAARHHALRRRPPAGAARAQGPGRARVASRRRPPRDRRPDRGRARASSATCCRRPRRPRRACSASSGTATSSSAPPRCCSAPGGSAHSFHANRVARNRDDGRADGAATCCARATRFACGIARGRRPRAPGAAVADTPAARSRRRRRSPSRCWPTVRASAEVMTAALPELPRTAVWVQMSTVGADWADRLTALAAEHGVEIVDAPLMGSRPQAEEASCCPWRRAREAACKTIAPVLDAFSRGVLWLGDQPGVGSRLKLVVNHWILNSVENLAQTLGVRRGARPRSAPLPGTHLGRTVRHAVRALEGRADAGGGAFPSPSRSSSHARTS